MTLPPFAFEPIGVVHSPYREKISAPRQPLPNVAAPATIELFAGRNFEHALADVDAWEYLWVVFVFHQNAGWRPKVLPPRRARRRVGVFATRSPHRPNPIGLSVVKLERVEGRVLHLAAADMLDGTPVLDLKPYVAYADALPHARGGWLQPAAGDDLNDPRAPDPDPGFNVRWSDLAALQADWVQRHLAFDLRNVVTGVLTLGPQPHPYRRIRPEGDGFRLACKAWRVRFRVTSRLVTVTSVHTGYRPRDLALGDEPAHALHRRYVQQFGS